MARPLRSDIEDGLYHVTSRGGERRAGVRDDQHRHRWRELLERVATRCGWRVFAGALLSNHFHLDLRTPQPNLSAGMHDINSGDASRFNLAQDRSRARSADRRFVEAGLWEPPASPLKGAAGGMFLGSRAWGDRWSRRLAEEPARESVPMPRAR